jgi:membrane-associated PAP2 superfamily phosphatase
LKRLGWHAAALAGAALVIWLGFVRTGLDFALSGWFYDPAAHGFPLRDAWLTEIVGHKGLKYVGTFLWFGLLGVAIAFREWRREALHAALGAALAASAVTLLRGWSAHSCPWDLALYGGSGQWFPIFGATPAEPGPGRCLPSGHASSGFALFSLYFALHRRHSRLARWGLALAWTLGVLTMADQVARGAHFASHGLWTAWVSWAVNALLDAALWRLKPSPPPPILSYAYRQVHDPAAGGPRRGPEPRSGP